MDSEVRRTLIDLNLDLYRRFAREFSESRRHLQAGILRALKALGEVESLLDIGCGDARVGRMLRAGTASPEGRQWKGWYAGVDASRALLDLAPPPTDDFDLIQADLSKPGWSQELHKPGGGFASMVIFSFLHHIPGRSARQAFLQEAASFLIEGGPWALSVWQFLHLPRFRDRIVPWSRIGLTSGDVEANDVLLEWRRGGEGLRYVHDFESGELIQSCEEAGLEVEDTYRSDGRSGDLGLYLIGKKSR